MTGRFKGGKGLCKGGAKRHCKVLRDNIQGITKSAKHGLIYKEIRGAHTGSASQSGKGLILRRARWPKDKLQLVLGWPIDPWCLGILTGLQAMWSPINNLSY